LGKGLLILGLLGPMLGGIGFTYLTQGPEGRRDYWARIIDPRRIPPRWYLVILLFAPGLWAVAVLLDVASGASTALAQIAKTVAPLLAAPSTIVPFVLGAFVYGPIPEELGWRGYVLDRLQARWSALASSLVLGALWAAYHLPLFYMRDTFHAAQGAWSPWFFSFMVQVVAAAVIFTWIFNNTRRSTLAAILFHLMLNVTAELLNVTGRTNFYSTLLWVAAAIAVVAFWGAATLTRCGRAPVAA
jgi:membrane protease YdiL (CAAX protease family)